MGAGTRLVDLYAALASAGVLVPGGSCPTVGVAGLALGGGVGVLGRRYGLTADVLESLQVVTADARLLHVDQGSEPDLYWASRGGGGRNFAIATSFEFATAPIPPLALFTLEYPWAAAGDLLGAWAAWIDGAPDELWSNCLLLSAGSSGLIARATGVYAGEVAALADLLARLRSAVDAAPTTDFVGADTYLNTMLVEAGCAELTLAQCHLSAPGSPAPSRARPSLQVGVLRQGAAAGRARRDHRRARAVPGGSPGSRAAWPSTATAARSTPSRRTRRHSSTATRSASCR